MTNEMPIMQQPLVAPATPEQQLVAATLPPTANQPAPGAKMPERSERPEKVEFDLFDGRHVIIRRGKGRNLVNALRITDIQQEQVAIMAASASEVDGKALHYEDFLDFDLEDFSEILLKYQELMGN